MHNRSLDGPILQRLGGVLRFPECVKNNERLQRPSDVNINFILVRQTSI